MDGFALIGLIVTIIGTTTGVIQTWIALKQYLSDNESTPQPSQRRFGKKKSIFASFLVTILILGVIRDGVLRRYLWSATFNPNSPLNPPILGDFKLICKKH